VMTGAQIGSRKQQRRWRQAEPEERGEFRVALFIFVAKLIAVLLRIYNDRKPQDILDTPAEFVSALNLEQHLSATRSNGLASMLQAIHRFAGGALHAAR